MKFFEWMTLILFGFNLAGIIDISYWIVFLPLIWQWVFAPLITGVFIGCVVAMIDDDNGNKDFSNKFKKVMINKLLGSKQELQDKVNKEQI